MKSIKVLSALSLLALAGTANAEVTGSMGIASSYLWRGVDLGSGTPAVYGDLKVSGSGFYAGVWGSSGDALSGSEYDLFAGYGGSAGDFSYDISYWTYAYPTSAEIPPGDLAEIIGSVGYGPVSVFYNHGIADLEDYSYYGVKAKFGSFGAVLAKHDESMTHLDLSYTIYDNLTFTVSKQLSDEIGSTGTYARGITDAVYGIADYFDSSGGIASDLEVDSREVTDDLKFVVSYSIPFGK